MNKSSEYDEKIAIYEAQLKEWRAERRKLRTQEARIEARRQKATQAMFLMEHNTIKEKCEIMEEWLRRKAITVKPGQQKTLWECFVQEYPVYGR